MNILLIEPYYSGSHKDWADSIKKYSKHNITLLTMHGRGWKWRMNAAAYQIADKYLALLALKEDFDLIIVSDMLDLCSFLAITRKKTSTIPVALYFHENQLTYPWSKNDKAFLNKEDKHYKFINISSALAADRLYFNSNYHLQSFTKAAPIFLKKFPEYINLATIDELSIKSLVLYPGLDFTTIKNTKNLQKDVSRPPVIVFNHRWEYDKNPEEFFLLLKTLKSKGFDFKVNVLGESIAKTPGIFTQAKVEFKDEIHYWGYAKSRSEYFSLLWQSDIAITTSYQDFFGLSFLEAIACGCYPLYPDRLTYSELLGKKYEQHCYASFENLSTLCSQLLGQQKMHPPQNLQDHVEKYSWAKMIGEYDNAFEKMVGGNKLV